MQHLARTLSVLVLATSSFACTDSEETSVATTPIIGGKNARIQRHPWQVSLQLPGATGFQHICGGSIVRSNWIVTAAHCVDFPVEEFEIVAGATTFDDATAQRRRVSRIIQHPDWPFDPDADIALMELAEPLALSDVPRAITLASLDDNLDLPGQAAEITGWGLAGTEEIDNPGFERGTADWKPSRTGIFTTNTTDVLLGSAAGQLALRRGGTNHIEQQVDVTGGTVYVFEYLFNTNAASGTASAKVVWRNGNRTLRTETVKCSGADWQFCSSTLTAPARANNAQIRMVVSAGTGHALFDTVTLLTPLALPTNLQKAALHVVDTNALFGFDDRVLLVEDPIDGGVGACFGDSGGPLVVRTNNGPRLIGVTSRVFVAGEDRCLANFPSIYTRVATQREFLDANLPL